MPHLFSELKLRGATLSNRIGVSPMCQYSCVDGYANDWHFAHLASRAVGGAALVFTEAAAVTPEGRISPEDLGAWSEKHFEPLERIARFVASQGAVAGIQLAHAGRKGSTYRPWSGQGAIPEALGGWRPVGPSAVAFAENYWTPTELSVARIGQLQQAFATAAARAYAAGFRVIEMHAAHGYLFHEFYSPFSNRRSDAYGGGFENRTRMLRETVAAVREALPDSCPLLVRISSTDWTEGGWDAEQSVALARELKSARRRRDRLLLGRQCREGGDPGRCGLSGPLRRPHPARSRNRDRRRRHDHRPRPGRSDRPQRRGRYRPARARNAA